MKKTSLIALTIILIAALFTGCRRPQPDTTGSKGSTPAATTTTPASSSTVRPGVTTPSQNTSGTPGSSTPESTGVLPDLTMPSGSSGGDMTRGRRGPRF